MKRGQATVETVLGILVVIPIVLGLITFAELGVAGLKVKEAEYAALWDVPAHQTHELNPITGPRRWDALATQGTLAARSAAFSQRYQSLRGLGSEAGNPNVLLQVQGVQVRCEERPAEHRPFRPTGSDLYALKGVYGTAGSAARCSAQAQVRITGVPDFTISIFGEPILRARDLTLCGTRGVGGSCALGPVLLTDTWAFAGKQENSTCLVASCDNPAVKDLPLAALSGAATFPGPTAAMAMAKAVKVIVPAPEANATFAGSEDSFLDGVALAHGDATWAPTPFTVPFHQLSYTRRKAGYPAIDLREPKAALSP